MISHAHGWARVRRAVGLVLVATVLGSAPASGQPESLPVDPPDGPAKDGFDITRFSGVGNGWFETLLVVDRETISTREAWCGRVSSATPTETGWTWSVRNSSSAAGTASR